jgi:hypothetical protein
MLNKRVGILCCFLIMVFSATVLAAPATGSGTVTDKPLVLTAPHSGETWPAGTAHKITWNYQASFKGTAVQILLLKGETVAATIAASTAAGSAGQGSYIWNTASVAPGSDYRIRIVGVTAVPDRNAPTDTSGYFTISDKAKLIITAPHAGDTLHPGDNVTISWNYSGDIGATVFIRLVHAGPAWWDGISNKAAAGSGGHGSFTWVVGDYASGGNYLIAISSDYADAQAESAVFKIANPHK